jgi:histidinol dehydrogenase
MAILKGEAAAERVQELSERGQKTTRFEKTVRPIVEDVRRNGDRALRKYAERWDGLHQQRGERGQSLMVTSEEMQSAWESLSRDSRAALREAASRVRQFCSWQMPAEWIRSKDGVRLGQVIRPLASVGCYVPGGLYPLPSTLLMTVIPAQVAGVPDVCVASPNPRPATMAAAAMLGVREFYRIGGAQAIAALAYGTKSIPRVQKIVGPGNAYVTAAKKLVAFDCSIDMLAGPTEAVVLLESGNPTFIASDLVAQAEHDQQAIPVFVTSSRKLAQAVEREIKRLVSKNAIAQQAWRNNGCVLLAKSHAQAITWANGIAPEHITVARNDIAAIQAAGSIFVGDYSAQPAGDYASGPNHVLPTKGSARFRGGLSVLDFLKVITVQELTPSGVKSLAPTVIQMAELEGLKAHADSIRVRCNYA